jgi:hypothetical protein
MKNKTAEAILRIVGNRETPEVLDIENYQSRPAAVRSRGYPSPPPDSQYGLVSPLTEQSRTEVEVIVPVPAGATSVSFFVASSITMTDAAGSTVVFNYNTP